MLALSQPPATEFTDGDDNDDAAPAGSKPAQFLAALPKIVRPRSCSQSADMRATPVPDHLCGEKPPSVTAACSRTTTVHTAHACLSATLWASSPKEASVAPALVAPAPILTAQAGKHNTLAAEPPYQGTHSRNAPCSSSRGMWRTSCGPRSQHPLGGWAEPGPSRRGT